MTIQVSLLAAAALLLCAPTLALIGARRAKALARRRQSPDRRDDRGRDHRV